MNLSEAPQWFAKKGELYMSMKRMALFVLALLILLVTFNGCFFFSATKGKGEKITSYTDETALPQRLVDAGERYYMLKGQYNGTSWKVTTGTSFTDQEEVYAVENVTIWDFYAEGDYAAWVEKSETQYAYKVYDRKNDRVTQFCSAMTEDGFQQSKLVIRNGVVYYAITLYAQRKAVILSYTVETEAVITVRELDFCEEYTVASMTETEEGLLVAVNTPSRGDALLALNPVTGDSRVIAFPEDTVSTVYDVSYDAAHHVYALYYADTIGKEHIATWKEGDATMRNIFTFSTVGYAYRDRVECRDGMLYWIEQLNTSGRIADHYRFISYDYQKDTYKEYKMAYDFCLNDKGKPYYLTFDDEKGTKVVHLYQAK